MSSQNAKKVFLFVVNNQTLLFDLISKTLCAYHEIGNTMETCNGG